MNLPPLEILRYPSPILTRRSRALTTREIVEGSAEGLDLRELVERMVEAMRAAGGLGLASPQVGWNLRIFVASVSMIRSFSGFQSPKREPPLICFNPVLSDKSGLVEMEEGCLSLPGVTAKVKRANKLVLTGVDEKWQVIRRECSGLEASVFQHEVDHLDGVLILS